jgi:hypothetical protein
MCLETARQNFERDVTSELRVARAIDLPHAAGAEGGEDFVRAEADACQECHLTVRNVGSVGQVRCTGTS